MSVKSTASQSPIISGALRALRRAARNARKISEETGTPFYVWEDGRVVDLNRKLDDISAFIPASDGIAIPGNLGIDEAEKELRVQSFFNPYHNAISALIQSYLDQGIVPALISIHSCTPVFDRIVRPWHVGVLWDQDPRIAVPMIEKLRDMDGICSGDNEPYSGRHPHDFTIDYHAERLGLPHVGIEVRQDLIQTQAGARRWANVLVDALEGLLSEQSL